MTSEACESGERWLASMNRNGRRITIRGITLWFGASAIFGVFLGGAFFGGVSRSIFGATGAAANNLGGEIALAFITPILATAIYLIPTFIALKQWHRHTLAIFICNVIGGAFYGLGWLAALIWVSNISATAPTKPLPETADEGVKS